MDAGAYFVGRTWGRRKLAPRLSPHKTVEGAVGAFIVALVVTVGFGLWFRLPAGHLVALGALFGVAGQVGDLGKSVFKRQAGAKDYGSIIPGHGGVLDRFDSLLFCAPVAYYYLYLLLHFHLPLFDL
jgi:phosphatidate cytidylyltransferase